MSSQTFLITNCKHAMLNVLETTLLEFSDFSLCWLCHLRSVCLDGHAKIPQVSIVLYTFDALLPRSRHFADRFRGERRRTVEFFDESQAKNAN
jgi:hypothetical protein